MPQRRIPLLALLPAALLAGCLDSEPLVEPTQAAQAGDVTPPTPLAGGEQTFQRIAIDYVSDADVPGTLTVDAEQFAARGNAPSSLEARLRVTHVNGLVQAPPKSIAVPMAVLAVGAPQPPCRTPGTLEVVLAPGGFAAPGIGRLAETRLTVHDAGWRGGGGPGRVICTITQLLQTRAAPAAIAAQMNNLLRELRRQDPFGLGRLVEILSSDKPPLEADIGSGIHVRLVGKGELVSGPPVDPVDSIRAVGPDEPDEVETRPGMVPMRMFNSRTRNEFEITMAPALAREIHLFRVARGLTRATEGVDDPGALESPRGGGIVPDAAGGPHAVSFALSNGVDNRFILNQTTAWPWRTISQFTYGATDNSGCTGTLVGPRHLVTNAHCINEAGTDRWFTATVAPGRNGTGEGSHPFGSSTVSTTPAPGTEVWYFTPEPWRQSGTQNRGQWDYGVIVIPDRLGDLTGWMGYGGLPAAQLNPRTHYNRGYPQCGGTRPDVPEDCETARLYGDASPCTLGNYIFMGGNGWNRNFHHSCDTSAGHSGSPVYNYLFDSSLGQYVPVVMAVHYLSVCDRSNNNPCGESDTRPSRARRFDPEAVDVISFFRQAFP